MIQTPTLCVAGALFAALASSATAQAQPPAGKTRAEVKADLASARKNGDLPEGELDQTPRALRPKSYPQPPKESGLTRAQVKSETQAAIRAGDISVGESGKTLAEEDPARYEGAPAKPPKLSLHRRAKTAAPSASTGI